MSTPLDQQMAAIARAVAQGQYRYTIHGARQRIARGLSAAEIEDAIQSGQIIEDYPQHHYGPCCLILGPTSAGKALHLVCSCRSVVDIITVYEPDPRSGNGPPNQEGDTSMTDQSRCSVCRAHLRAGTTTYTQEPEGRLAVVTDVPVLACPQCGELYFAPETVDRLQRLLTHGAENGPAPRTIEVPVYPFS